MSGAAATASTTLTSRADSDSSDNSGSGSFLSSGGSTLILAFLAIGLFIGGLLVMLSMRRYVLSSRRRIRTWQAAGERGWESEWDEAQGPVPMGGMSVMMRRRRDFGKKPELWDCQVEEAEKLRWENIQPIAAKLEYEDPALPSGRHPGDDPLRSALSSQNPSVPSLSPPGFFHPFQVGWRDFTNQLPTRRHPPLLFHPPGSPPSEPSASTPGAADRASPTMSPLTTQAQCMSVVVAITMPTEKPCTEGVPLFALGIADVPWHGCLPEDPPAHDATPYG
ncbi:hypothetical protein L226DRAFT_613547 [Lentinus tigrinus ALCF2SS1-7]|uniref:Uncharacterized protein n=1 Tax=Lentinus tigrinus ALCF2SS1-6 TaxID=1328759 RepID=A0A5C2RWS0_9APHY|nr:hypothetical protein L227DRAFT_336885 [Lentinus tigrinus ALCF2SS1-6]RPD74152.1 hypothetical protein L226DRAFT_613547 [Lentinus tigrinus ALCF2SS1-7]